MNTHNEPTQPQAAVLYGVHDLTDYDRVVDLVSKTEHWATELGLELTAEYIDDIGDAETPWAQRPRTKALLRDLSHRNNQVTTVLVPEPAPALNEDDLRTAVALLAPRYVTVCLPCGPIGPWRTLRIAGRQRRDRGDRGKESYPAPEVGTRPSMAWR